MRNRFRNGIFLGVGMMFVLMSSNISAQNPNLRGVAPVDYPAGGFAIDANLYANFPQTGIGDWIYTTLYPGDGGGVLTLTGVPIDPSVTRHSIDLVGNSDLDGFVEGSKFNQSPLDWIISAHSSPNKDDMQHVLIHFDYEPNTADLSDDLDGDLWFFMAGDRSFVKGTSYLDFELFQKTVAVNEAGDGYTSLGTDGGRTVGDMVITIAYSSGGDRPEVFVYRWESIGIKNGVEQFDYVLYTDFPEGTVYAASNIEGPINVPYGAFGSTTYPQYAFAEAGVNLFKVIAGIDKCKPISTVLVKTKASDALNAALKDVVAPIQVEINQPPVVTVNSPSVCSSDLPVTITANVSEGTAPFSYAWVVPDGAYQPGTDEASFETNVPGEYTVTVTDFNECVSEPVTATLTIYELPGLVIDGTNVTCYNERDGTVTVPANDYDLVLYMSDAENGTYAPVENPDTDENGNFIKLGPGWYYVEATESHEQGEGEDAVECTADSNKVEITQPDEITVSIQATNVSCYGEGDGSIQVDASGEDSLELYRSDTEEGTYTQVVDPNTDSDENYDYFTDLGPGFYKVKAIAAGGNEGDDDCFVWSDAAEIEEPDQITVSIEATNVSCYGKGDGSIQVDASGEDSLELYRSDTEEGTYTLVVDPNTDSDENYDYFTDLGPGFYKVKAIAAGGNEGDDDCFAWSDAAEIEEPAEVLVEATGYDPTCEDLSGGYITVTASGYDRLELWSSPDGIVDYSQVIADVTLDSDTNITGLGAGYYIVKAFAAGGNEGDDECTAETEPIILTEPICEEFDGCTLGYWKNHTDKWCPDYQTCTSYVDAFFDYEGGYNDAPEELRDLTLLEVLNLGGGGVYNFGRQSVAALLNACSGDVNYELPETTDVIDYVRNNVDNPDDAGSYLDMLNNAGCTMFGSSATTAPSEGCPASSSENLSADSGAPAGFTVAPVPFRDNLSLRFNFNYTSDVVIEIFNLSGNKVFKMTEKGVSAGSMTSINSSFARGQQLYIIRVSTDRDTFEQKVLSGK